MCHNATLVLMDHRGAEEQKVKNNLKLSLCLVNILDDDEPEEVLDVLHDQIRLKISTEVRACTRICSQLEKDGEERVEAGEVSGKTTTISQQSVSASATVHYVHC